MLLYISRILKFIIVILIIFVGFHAISIITYSQKNELVKSEAAIVLGAAVWENEPSPVFKARLDHAIWLYENNYVEALILTGGKGAEASLTEAEVARDYCLSKNIPIEDIFLETKSTITEENLRFALDVAKENSLHTFTVVSDPLHMKRAIVIAKDLGMEVYSSPTQTSAYKTYKSQIPFYFRELFYFVGYLIVSPFR